VFGRAEVRARLFGDPLAHSVERKRFGAIEVWREKQRTLGDRIADRVVPACRINGYRGSRARARTLRAVDADVYAVFGASSYAAEVTAFSHARGKKVALSSAAATTSRRRIGRIRSSAASMVRGTTCVRPRHRRARRAAQAGPEGDHLMQSVQAEYDRVLAHCERLRARLPEYLMRQSKDHQQGLYRMYETLLDAIPVPLAGKTVADFGCKYGHLIPLLFARGARDAIGIDAEEEYVTAGKAVFESLYPNARLVRSEIGFIPLQPQSVDVVIMNEVISHVNPTFLDTVWREAARILRPGGVLFISDGNNAASDSARRKLVDLYEKWENGPAGAKTDRDEVTRSFLDRRKDYIRARHPSLAADKVDLLAANTSGLFGEYFLRTVDAYVAGGELIRRPYVKGTCPASPHESGVVMERAFLPQQLELALIEYGFQARQLVPQPKFGRPGALGPLKDMAAWLRQCVRSVVRPDWHRFAYEGFQIVAVKRNNAADSCTP
jgi:SAM-dependent methyltransferase